jgi:BASS family bile acid:Na+ symporter
MGIIGYFFNCNYSSCYLKERENVVSYFQQVGLPALLFNILSMLVGYQIPRLLNIFKKQVIAIGMEIGIQNGT